MLLQSPYDSISKFGTFCASWKGKEVTYVRLGSAKTTPNLIFSIHVPPKSPVKVWPSLIVSMAAF